MAGSNSFPTQVIRVTRASHSDILRLPSGDVSFVIESGASLCACAVIEPGLSGGCIKIVLEEGARLELLRIVRGGGVVSETSLDLRQARDSQSRVFFLTAGGAPVRDQVHVLLEGEGASAFVNGLHHVGGEAEAQSHTFVDHAAPSTMSSQLYKSVLRDKARSVFNGRIMVRREAQLTNAYQLNKNLLLSPEARVDTKPQLEIFADDVKCSHGAAIGQLDDEELFYLQTRGISRTEAGRMLVDGFIEDVLAQITHPALCQEARKVLGEGVSHV